MNIEQDKMVKDTKRYVTVACVSIVTCWVMGFISGWFINRDKEECVIEQNCVVEIDPQQHEQCIDALMVSPENRVHLIQAYCGI